MVILFALVISVFGLISPMTNANTSNLKQNSLQVSTTQMPSRVLTQNNAQTKALKTSNQKSTNNNEKISVSKVQTSTNALGTSSSISTIQPMALNTVSTASGCGSSQNYTMTVSSSLYNWYNAYTNGVDLGISGDDVAGSLSLPFNFDFYNGTFNTVYISSNGWLSFNNTNPTAYSNPTFPDIYDNYVIAPYWDDLVTTGSGVYGYTTSTYAVMEFVNSTFYAGGLAGTFEVVLYSNGSILFNYQSMGAQNSPTVGLNSGYDPTLFNTYTADLSYVSNFAIYFTPGTINYPDLAVCMSNQNSVLNNTATTISASVFNIGNSTETNIPFSLFQNGTIVNSTTIPQLTNGSSYTLTYNWLPTTQGVYNFTAYATPATDENVTSNNVFTQFVGVTTPEINPAIGDYIEWVYNLTGDIEVFNFTFTNWISPTVINASLTENIMNGATGVTTGYYYYYLEIDILTRSVVDSNMWWSGSNYLNWIQTNLTVGNILSVWLDTSATVVSQTTLNWQGNVYNVSVVQFSDGGSNENAYYDMNSGVLLFLNGTTETGFLNATNLISVNPVPLSSILVPEITDSGTVNYYIGSTGNYITWTIMGQNPNTYIITDYNNATVSEGNWFNETPITIYVDGLSAGTYFYNLTANDTLGHIITDTVYVYVSVQPPTLVDYGSVSYNVGQTGNQIEWVGTSNYPGTYSITDYNYYTVASGSWSSGVPIYFNVDGLSTGTYWYQITLLDSYGNSVYDTVYVYVSSSPLGISDNVNGALNYVSGTTGHSISWTGTGTNPSTYTLTDENYNTIATGSWSSNVPVTINVDGLSQGIHQYTMEMQDTYGNSVYDTVYINVFSPTANPLSHPADINYNQGTTGNSIVWNVNSTGSTYHYSITQNGAPVVTNIASSSSSIVQNVDGLSVGTYNYTVNLKDFNGIHWYDSVIVSVTQTRPTSTTNSASSTSTIKTSPGFEMIFLFAGLIALYFYKKRRF